MTGERLLLESLTQAMQPAGGGGAVDDAMVEGQAERNSPPDDEVTAPNDRFFDDATHSQDRGLGQIEDRSEGVYAEHPEVRDGEGAA